MFPKLFVTVTTDAGIVITQFGQLASGEVTTQSLIGGTISALRDIISTETTRIESRFMNGHTENSEFGTFSFHLGSDRFLAVTYVLSTSEGVIPIEILPHVQLMARSFGYQLLQTQNIEKYMETGKQIDPVTVATAYLNASTVAQFDNPLPPAFSDLNNRFLSMINDYIVSILDSPQDIPLFRDLDQSISQLNEPQYWKNGFLTWHARENLLNDITDSILWEIVNLYPLHILLSDAPRKLNSILEKMIQEKIQEKFPNAETFVITQLSTSLQKIREQVLQNISLGELHITKHVLRESIIKESILANLRSNPYFSILSLKQAPILQAAEKLLESEGSETTIATIIIESLQPYFNPQILSYIKNFLSTFVSSLGSLPLTEANWQLLSTFLTPIVPKDLLVEAISIKYPDKSSWIKEINENFHPVQRQKLPIQDMEEAKAIWLSLSVASTRTIAQLLYEEFITDDPERFGHIIHALISKYHELGEIILSSSLIHHYIRFLTRTLSPNYPFDIKPRWFTPTAYDLFISAGILKGALFINESKASLTRRFIFKKNPWKLKVNRTSILIEQLRVNQNYHILLQLDDEMINLDALNSQPKIMIRFFLFPSVVSFATQLAFKRNLYETLLHPFNSALRPIIAFLDTIIHSKSISRSIQPLALPDLTLPSVTEDKDGQVIYRLHEKINAKFLQLVDEFTQTKWSEEPLASIKKKAKTLLKSIKSFQTSLSQELQSYIKALDSLLKRYSRELESSIQFSSENQILYFREKLSHILVTEKELAKHYKPFLQKSTPAFIPSNKNLLHYTVASTLFSNLTTLISNQSSTISGFNTEVQNVYDFLKQNNATIDYVINLLSWLVTEIEEQYVKRDAPIVIENDAVFVEIFTESVNHFLDHDEIRNTFPFSKLIFQREAGIWLARIHLTDLSHFKSEIPLLVTISDVIRYILLREFRESTSGVLSGVGLVIQFLEAEATNRLNSLKENLENLVFLTR